jgi:hypothetical protein
VLVVVAVELTLVELLVLLLVVVGQVVKAVQEQPQLAVMELQILAEAQVAVVFQSAQMCEVLVEMVVQV